MCSGHWRRVCEALLETQLEVVRSSLLRVNSLVDEVHGLCFELVGAVQVGQDEDLSRVFHRQAGAQSVLAHDLQSLQSILAEGGEKVNTLPFFIAIQLFTEMIFEFKTTVKPQICI